MAVGDIKKTKAENDSWAIAQKTIEAERQKVTAMRQSNAENRIQMQVMSQFGATQDDVNLAISDYNIVQAESALSIATVSGATEQEVAVLREKLAALRETRDLQAERKEDTDTNTSQNDTFAAGWKRSFKQYEKDATSSAKIAESAFSSFAGASEDALNTFITTGKFSFADFTKSILADLAKMAAKQAILTAFKASGLFADGGAFSGGVQFFADGGVVNSPTAFAMSGGIGVMGEAGAEAVMPLKRGADGKLGVVASGSSGGASQTVNNYNMSVNVGSVDSSERKAELLQAIHEQMVATSKQTVANEMRQGGMLSRR